MLAYYIVINSSVEKRAQIREKNTSGDYWRVLSLGDVMSHNGLTTEPTFKIEKLSNSEKI